MTGTDVIPPVIGGKRRRKKKDKLTNAVKVLGMIKRSLVKGINKNGK